MVKSIRHKAQRVRQNGTDPIFGTKYSSEHYINTQNVIHWILSVSLSKFVVKCNL